MTADEIREQLDAAGRELETADQARDIALAKVTTLARQARGLVPIAQIAELGRVSRPTVYKMLAAEND